MGNRYDAVFRVLVDAPHMKPGVRMAWMMFRANYTYSRSHGLSRWESFTGAVPMIDYLWRK